MIVIASLGGEIIFYYLVCYLHCKCVVWMNSLLLGRMCRIFVIMRHTSLGRTIAFFKIILVRIWLGIAIYRLEMNNAKTIHHFRWKMVDGRW